MSYLRNPSVYLRLYGGLGNQIFQFSAALKVASIINDVPSNIFIDTRFLASYESKHCFEIDFLVKLFPGITVGHPPLGLHSLISKYRIAKLYDAKLSKYFLLGSVDSLYSNDFKNIESVIMDGYFQDPRILFNENQRLAVRNSIAETAKPLTEKYFNKKQTIGVHIRRGDYVTSKSSARIFNHIPIEYYYEALKFLPKNCSIFVFSDDREISAKFALDIGGIDVSSLLLTTQEEFFLLMSCNHYVIANSTFSWWASYLGHNSDSISYAPARWYKNPAMNKLNLLISDQFLTLDF